jgi:hypothetical protein
MVEKPLSRRSEARRRALLKDYVQLVADLIENGNEAARSTSRRGSASPSDGGQDADAADSPAGTAALPRRLRSCQQLARDRGGYDGR